MWRIPIKCPDGSWTFSKIPFLVGAWEQYQVGTPIFRHLGSLGALEYFLKATLVLRIFQSTCVSLLCNKPPTNDMITLHHPSVSFIFAHLPSNVSHINTSSHSCLKSPPVFGPILSPSRVVTLSKSKQIRPTCALFCVIRREGGDRAATEPVSKESGVGTVLAAPPAQEPHSTVGSI